MEFPKYLTAIDVDVVYQGTKEGVSEATTAIEVIRKVFPNSRITVDNAGKSGSLIIYCKNKTIFDQRCGDTGLDRNNVGRFV
jgi:hypothetical protein